MLYAINHEKYTVLPFGPSSDLVWPRSGPQVQVQVQVHQNLPGPGPDRILDSVDEGQSQWHVYLRDSVMLPMY